MTLLTFNSEKENVRISLVGTILIKETGDSCVPGNSLLKQIFLPQVLKGK